jgi:D-tyrosyl-tRNA(Tyr) deacylase
MKALVQRVSKASVRTGGETIGSIGKGLLVLLGVKNGDTIKDAEYLADKTINLRVFEDSEGKMNLSALDLKLDILVVSQFTLYADTRRGRRPSFTEAAPPEIAESLCEEYIKAIRKSLKAEEGRFRAMMEVELINDGPVTIMLEYPL